MQTAPDLLQIAALASEAGLIHGFSTLAIGSVGLTHAPDPHAALSARRAFARRLGVDADTLTVAGAVHGAKVARVLEPWEVIQGVDGLVTDRPGLGLFATFADCYPILLWDRAKKCVALAHAGWRGTHAGVAAEAARVMREDYGCRDIVAGIGPGICGRCYEVGAEVASKFDARFVTAGHGDRFLLDLAAANRAGLEEAGVREVHVLGVCTKESDFLPSHRREPDGARFGAIVAIHA
ncbi:MAG TPA: polyphenol oxidase family protein [Candidatus Dormibacteraeota bacterium]|nr:polyphenol oxidase family protein [Candidatus Dormibacteraeota bacterium]